MVLLCFDTSSKVWSFGSEAIFFILFHCHKIKDPEKFKSNPQINFIWIWRRRKKDLKNQEKGEQACITSNHLLQKESKEESEKVWIFIIYEKLLETNRCKGKREDFEGKNNYHFRSLGDSEWWVVLCQISSSLCGWWHWILPMYLLINHHQILLDFKITLLLYSYYNIANTIFCLLFLLYNQNFLIR